jgi:hypothetical protein
MWRHYKKATFTIASKIKKFKNLRDKKEPQRFLFYYLCISLWYNNWLLSIKLYDTNLYYLFKPRRGGIMVEKNENKNKAP